MKSKLILLILVLVALVVTLAACGGTAETTANETTTVPVVTTTPLDGDDAMAAYEYVSEKMNALKGFEATLVEEQTVGFNNTKLVALLVNQTNLACLDLVVDKLLFADNKTRCRYPPPPRWAR